MAPVFAVFPHAACAVKRRRADRHAIKRDTRRLERGYAGMDAACVSSSRQNATVRILQARARVTACHAASHLGSRGSSSIVCSHGSASCTPPTTTPTATGKPRWRLRRHQRVTGEGPTPTFDFTPSQPTRGIRETRKEQGVADADRTSKRQATSARQHSVPVVERS
jgi:formate-dependent nitrite reductase cytochrome c552 subunit